MKIDFGLEEKYRDLEQAYREVLDNSKRLFRAEREMSDKYADLHWRHSDCKMELKNMEHKARFYFNGFLTTSIVSVIILSLFIVFLICR